ncbi:MAG: hypothetical protein ACLSG5_03090 [Oscillospiraceae bacterium]
MKLPDQVMNQLQGTRCSISAGMSGIVPISATAASFSVEILPLISAYSLARSVCS